MQLQPAGSRSPKSTGGDPHDPTSLDAARAAALEQKAAHAEQKRSRRTPENPIPTAAGDRRELLRQPVWCQNSVRAPRNRRFAGRAVILAPHTGAGKSSAA
jgi:hypothetical protein